VLAVLRKKAKAFFFFDAGGRWGPVPADCTITALFLAIFLYIILSKKIPEMVDFPEKIC
jgi:hypothetical protein